jgi:hypothetical protein
LDPEKEIVVADAAIGSFHEALDEGNSFSGLASLNETICYEICSRSLARLLPTRRTGNS